VASLQSLRERRAAPFILGAVALAAVVLIWLLFIRGDNGSDNTATGVNKPRIVDQNALAAFAGSVGHDVYWAGKQGDAKLELTNTSDGRVYVRYLTGGADAGDPRPSFLTIGTYPQKDALSALQQGTSKGGYTTLKLQGGAFGAYNQQRPSSVYFALPGSGYEVEVYDPSPQKAIQLVTRGQVQPVGSG
jgi:hypothetical protein